MPPPVTEPRPPIERFAEQRLLVIGDLVADHYVYGESDRVSREAPVLIVRYEGEEIKPGGAANAAANARALGANVTLIGVVGTDPRGRELCEALASLGVQLEIVEHPALRTETKTRILAGGVSTTRQQMLRLDTGNRPPLPDEVHGALADRARRAATSASAVLLSDYGAGVVDEALLAQARDWSRQGLRVCGDSRYCLDRMKGFSVLKPNEPELESLVGRPLRDRASLLEAASTALTRQEAEAMVVTRGRDGMLLVERGGCSTWIPVHGAGEAVDVTGAGDTVGATLALALGSGASVSEAARIANVAGGLVVQKAGTAVVTSRELREALEAA